jgi:hypothetical protein
MSDDLVKRLRELRSNQYADPNTAPEFVFLDPDLPPSEWEKQYGMDVVYVRADRIEELEAKLAALTSAAIKVHDSYWNSTDGVITGMYDLEWALRLAELKGEDRG